SSTLYFDSLTVNAGNGGFLHCFQLDTSVNAANQVVFVGADIAFDADLKFFAFLFVLSFSWFRILFQIPFVFILLLCRLVVVVSFGADIAFDAEPKFFACLVRFESSSVPTTLPTAYDVYPLDGRHDGGYYTVKDCVTIDVLPRTPGNNVYVGFMVWSNFTATK